MEPEGSSPCSQEEDKLIEENPVRLQGDLRFEWLWCAAETDRRSFQLLSRWAALSPDKVPSQTAFAQFNSN
jgi:hypothetical protein